MPSREQPRLFLPEFRSEGAGEGIERSVGGCQQSGLSPCVPTPQPEQVMDEAQSTPQKLWSESSENRHKF